VGTCPLLLEIRAKTHTQTETKKARKRMSSVSFSSARSLHVTADYRAFLFAAAAVIPRLGSVAK
jgi:hypothetical protein